MDYIIGVDSGGTSTKVVAYDKIGTPLFETKGGFGNLLNDRELAIQNLESTVSSVLEDLGRENCLSIIFGIAGVDSGGFKEVIEETFMDYPGEIVVMNDAWLAHYALLEGQEGCLVISGTGSIVLGRSMGREDRVGGWGNLLGDEGSGYDIAKRLIQAVLQAYDMGRPLTSLEKGLYQYLKIDSPFALTSFVYSSSKDQVSKIALFIADAVENGDEQAAEILERAGQELGKQTIMLLQKLNIMKKPLVAVTGSVLNHNQPVYRSFQQTVLETYPDTQFIKKDISNTLGAYYYYYP